MEIIALWFVFSVLVGMLSGSRGHSGAGAFVISLVLSPIIGLIIVLVSGDRRGGGRIHPDIDATWNGRRIVADTRSCPRCAEDIKRAAVVCRFCQADVSAEPPEPARPVPRPRVMGSLWMAVLIVLFVIIAVVAGISQFGTRPNTSFNAVSAAM